MRNAGLEETQAGIKIAGRNINNLRYVDDTTLMAESSGQVLCAQAWKPGSQHAGEKRGVAPLRQTQRSPEGPRHLHRIPRLSEAPWEVP